MSNFWKILAATLIAGALSVATAVESYPSRPVRLVVPYPPGGGSDAVARLVAAKVSSRFPAALVIENKPGVGAIVGTDTVAKARPDGYTLLFTSGIFVQAPSLFKKLPFDIFKDFEPITLIGYGPLVLVARSGMPATLDGVVARAKSAPGAVTYGTYGIATTGHLYSEMLRQAAGVDIFHVPYKGTSAVVSALLAGEVDIGIVDYQAAEQHVKAGKLRALAITGTRRFGSSGVPTFAELGYKGFDSVGFYGVLAPAGTPRAVIDSLSQAFNDAVRDSDVQRAFAETMFLEPWARGPSDFAQQLRKDQAQWQSIIQRTGVEAP